MEGKTLKKLATLGGPIKVNNDMKGYYFGDSIAGGKFSKEKLFGKAGRGPIHPGMPSEKQVTLGALHSDTRGTLIGELTEQTHLTRREAEDVVQALLREGVLEEINDPTLGKILVFKGGA